MMAAHAAKYAHCHARYPVEYRSKVPFRPEIAAPLDFAVRAAEVYALDRELDRALLSEADHEALVLDTITALPGPQGLFRSDAPVGLAVRRPGARRTARPTLGPLRRQFVLNELRFRAQASRFHPPWNVALVQQAHAAMLAGLGVASQPGELRDEPIEVRLPGGPVAFRPPPPDRIGVELRAVLDWVDRYGVTLMPVIPATVLFQGFYTIRPFPVGNMTVARTLCDLYLRLFGLPNASLAPIVPATLEQPDLLRRLQVWTEASGSHTELLDYTLDGVLGAYENAVLRWLEAGQGTDPLEEVALRLVVRARRAPGWFSLGEAQRWVGGRSGGTVRRHLNALVDRGVLEALGQTRGKRYRLVSPLAVLPSLLRRFSGDEADVDVPGSNHHRSLRRRHDPDLPSRRTAL